MLFHLDPRSGRHQYIVYLTATTPEQLELVWRESHAALQGQKPRAVRRSGFYIPKRLASPPPLPFKLPAQPSLDFDWYGRDTRRAQSPVIRGDALALATVRSYPLSAPYFDCAVLLCRARHYAPQLLGPDYAAAPPLPATGNLLPTLSRWVAMVDALPAPRAEPVLLSCLINPDYRLVEPELLNEWRGIAERLRPQFSTIVRY